MLGQSVLMRCLAPPQAPTKVPIEYANFAFSLNLISELFEHTEINYHAIELVNGQQPPYGPILSLGPVDPEGLH